MGLRPGRVTFLTLLAMTVILLVRNVPAAACSEPGSDFGDVSLEDIDEREVVAIGRPEVVARTAWAWRWHWAGVVAFTQVWPVNDDATGVADAVWTVNDGRRKSGECYFGRDAEPVGSRMGFHVLSADGTVSLLTTVGDDSFDSVNPVDLTARYGEPVTVAPDTDRIEAALAPLTAERRVSYLLARAVPAMGAAAIVLFFVIRRSRRSTDQPLS